MRLGTMENKIVIVLVVGAHVIGRVSEGELTNPRVLVMSQGEAGIGVSLRTLMGDPELFFIGEAPYYISENSEINELYVEAVSGPRLIVAI